MIRCTSWESSAITSCRFGLIVCSLQILSRSSPLTRGIREQGDRVSDDVGPVSAEVLPLHYALGRSEQELPWPPDRSKWVRSTASWSRSPSLIM